MAKMGDILFKTTPKLLLENRNLWGLITPMFRIGDSQLGIEGCNQFTTVQAIQDVRKGYLSPFDFKKQKYAKVKCTYCQLQLDGNQTYGPVIAEEECIYVAQRTHADLGAVLDPLRLPEDYESPHQKAMRKYPPNLN